ncbi:hypothetical protein [aff. Roholtiella sp. LEGE 12411]|uniref:hypothetical protein n=1 Tax=aff. Roholtiella sp. LEGE 12411 TaxID=1828822 RepID=UPI00188046B0|nr:hypothetical protein [aff. Roholtiella sp. LEGE 12411]MBE9038760.1 hypothetical protein [aff. Roholtiella sp. LEGE 12411]
MKVIVKVVEKVTTEAHIDIPDGLSRDAIKQHITDVYNSGEIQAFFDISDVNFDSISAEILEVKK